MPVKGGAFERDISRKLSLWWTNNERDDIFWRTSTSGARATVRARKGKTTAGSVGDISLLDVIGKPLLDACSIELKRGYKTWSMMDVLDKKKDKNSTFEEFIIQSERERVDANTPYFMLITRRDGRKSLVTIPHSFFVKLTTIIPKPIQFTCIETSIRIPDNDSTYPKANVYVTMNLDDFLNWVKPSFFIEKQYLNK